VRSWSFDTADLLNSDSNVRVGAVSQEKICQAGGSSGTPLIHIFDLRISGNLV
jgi:hypothetical protein